SKRPWFEPRCPVDLFFVLDTSESVALRAKPPNFYIDQIKSFTERFIMELKDMRQPCDRSLTWNSGALHYSDEIILVRQLSDIATERQALISDIKGISYIGKGTHTDCAIKRGIAELLIGGSHYQENKYIVVVTDGHPLTGYKEPCGGIQEAANEARQHGVKVFSVAISPDQEDTRLSVIATDQNYRQNFTAADNSRSTQLQTIRSIIDMIKHCSTPLMIKSSISGKFGRPRPCGVPWNEGTASQSYTPDMTMTHSSLNKVYCNNCKLLMMMITVVSCFQGDRGGRGDKGERGHKGYKGDKGQRGTDGVDGRKGDPGFSGLAGCKGSPGPDGTPGEKGEQGTRGNRGPRGDLVSDDKGDVDGDEGDGDDDAGDDGDGGDVMVSDDVGDVDGDDDAGDEGDGDGGDDDAGDDGDGGDGDDDDSDGGDGDDDDGDDGDGGGDDDAGDGGGGDDGDDGPRGIKGAPGDRGQIGNRGEDGAPGNGTEGCHGFQGGKGTPGPKGDDGEPGNPGLDVSHTCKCGPLDLAFIVDSSESIGSTNFALAKDFIITVIDRLIKDQQVRFGFNESRVGVVQYSGDGAQEAVRLGDPNINTLTELKQAVRDLRWLAEATYTGEALQFSLTNMIDRLQQENRVVLVLTDGRSDITRDKTPLNTLCGKGIKVGGLGVKDYSGRQPNHEQLSAVVCTSDPKPGFSFVLENFAELLDDSFLQNLTTRICEDKKCPNYKCPISFSGDTDIVLMMDSSASVGQRNFDSSKTFVKRLAERFLSAERSGRAAVRVAVGQYSRERRMEAELTSNLTLLTRKIDAAIFQNDGTDVTKAMAFAMEQFKTSGGGNRKRKLVLFSDGRSQGVTEAMLEKRVRLVSEAGVELYVITVGNQVSEANLRSLVSRGRSYDVTYAQRHLFRVPDYPSLLRGVFYQTVSRRVSQA
uniref:Collagen, type VI, alpha 1 n=1 Tax=Oncorhynchus mykiss TaxID=8022 RepID=A0A8K9WQ60_ONCMY